MLRLPPGGGVRRDRLDADLPSLLVEQRAPRARAPADAPVLGQDAKLDVGELLPAGRPVEDLLQGSQIAGVDVARRAALPEIDQAVARESLESGVREERPPLHIPGDDPVLHAPEQTAELPFRSAEPRLGVAEAVLHPCLIPAVTLDHPRDEKSQTDREDCDHCQTAEHHHGEDERRVERTK